MFALPALFLLSGILRGASAVESVPTFVLQDKFTGENLTCSQCQPGFHMSAPCTATTPTQCAPCGSNQFTDLWNYLPRCLYCNNFCTYPREVETECSPINNRVCRCSEGFYLTNDYCREHTECEPGQGVQAKGTSEMDTVCEVCPEGYFSNSSSALETCVQHQECSTGQITLLPGSVYQDSVCGTCEELAEGDKTLRMFLSGFFSMHRMRVAKLKKFVTRYIGKSVRRQRDLLLQQIKVWLAHAPEEQLRKLPQMLNASHCGSMAEKLEKRLLEIKQQNPGCSLTL
ncbi:tumor necrosis factor receptor superfamily member 6B-like [Toxotes jaculatrix]|uniref:tumor necrosis factor receptor superfamily member 6B-like n=1 Tax=Toxotes jaculatrix TaxID=941984 RepID=UPI001B3A7F54|nr:tumor necrosis factor receptor superfamily member 6B-like [Toxotes jaculatrix]